MSSQILITKDILFEQEYIITALLNENRLVEVNCAFSGNESILGNVYIGKVKKIVKNIQAGFVEFTPGQIGYLPMGDVNAPLMVKQARNGIVSEGDEIVVQITKEAVKSKEPTLSTNISFTGKYMVLTSENKKFGISKKLDSKKREKIKEIFGDFKTNEFGVIIRTNAGNDSPEKIFAEYDSLKNIMQHILDVSAYRTCFSCLHEAAPQYISFLESYPFAAINEIKTDIPLVYQQISEASKNTSYSAKLKLYEDDKITLSSLYGLKHKIQDALKPKVWLKSGAYLIIEPTEALTVIDVNSGKNIYGKKEDYFLGINLEAAKEIAHQLRLRNISGICIVDFINLDSAEAKKTLLKEFRKFLQEDSIKTELIGMTKLGLVEVTRKKIKKPLREQFAEKH